MHVPGLEDLYAGASRSAHIETPSCTEQRFGWPWAGGPMQVRADRPIETQLSHSSLLHWWLHNNPWLWMGVAMRGGVVAQ
jgi:hypothetical protein